MNRLLNSRGQITIPQQIRDTLGLVPGTHVEFIFNEYGEVMLRKADLTDSVVQPVPQRTDRLESFHVITDPKIGALDLMSLLRQDS